MKVIEVLRPHEAESLVAGMRALRPDAVAEYLQRAGYVRIVDDAPEDMADVVPLSLPVVSGAPAEPAAVVDPAPDELGALGVGAAST